MAGRRRRAAVGWGRAGQVPDPATPPPAAEQAPKKVMLSAIISTNISTENN